MTAAIRKQESKYDALVREWEVALRSGENPEVVRKRFMAKAKELLGCKEPQTKSDSST